MSVSTFFSVRLRLGSTGTTLPRSVASMRSISASRAPPARISGTLAVSIASHFALTAFSSRLCVRAFASCSLMQLPSSLSRNVRRDLGTWARRNRLYASRTRLQLQRSPRTLGTSMIENNVRHVSAPSGEMSPKPVYGVQVGFGLFLPVDDHDG